MSMMSCTKEVRVEGPSRTDTIYKTVHDTIYLTDPQDTTNNDDPKITEGTTSCPSDWNIPAGTKLYPSAMYVVIDDKGTPVPIEDGDFLAAFIDGRCHGAVEAVTGTDNYTRFSLKVNLFQGEESRNDLKVELRFYSFRYKRIFISKLIPFEEDAILGQLYDGYKPKLWTY